MYILGLNPAVTLSSAAQLQGGSMSLGARGVKQDGTEWVYVTAPAAITGAGYVCIFDSAYNASMVNTSNDQTGLLVGVPAVAFASGEYGWLQVKGPASAVQAIAATAAYTRLNTVATSGTLDDNGSASAGLEVRGLVLTSTAASSGATTSTGILDYPQLGAAV